MRLLPLIKPDADNIAGSDWSTNSTEIALEFPILYNAETATGHSHSWRAHKLAF
jgi:hypothetical protein